MAQTVKVFKNVTGVTVTSIAGGGSGDYSLLTTTSTQQAVIKDVKIKGTIPSTLDLDGMTALTGTSAAPNLIASGSLFMGPSSTLKVKLNPIAPSFQGMFFTNGAEGIVKTIGSGVAASTGTDTALTSVVQTINNPGLLVQEACAIMIGEELNFFNIYNGTVRRFTHSTTAGTGESTNNNFTMGGGNNHCIATDGVKYLYSITSGASTTLDRYNVLTGVGDTLTTNQNVYGRENNGGSFLDYHDGKLYVKASGGTNTMRIIDLTTLDVTTQSGMSLPGSYSDGAGIVTNLAGDSYIVEQNEGHWGWFKIGTSTAFNITAGASNSSTEYGNGFMEVAPGIAFIFCEASDDLTIIDTNTTPPSWTHIDDASTRNATIENGFGNKFAAAGYLVRPTTSTTIDAYVSGVLVTEGI